MVELMPCAHCGERLRRYEPGHNSPGWYSHAITKDCILTDVMVFDNDINAWNTRAADPATVERICELFKTLASLRFGIREDQWPTDDSLQHFVAMALEGRE